MSEAELAVLLLTIFYVIIAIIPVPGSNHEK